MTRTIGTFSTEKRHYIPRDFGLYLKKKRISLKLSQSQLAKMSGLSQCTISHYEVGYTRWPRLKNFFALLEVLEK